MRIQMMHNTKWTILTMNQTKWTIMVVDWKKWRIEVIDPNVVGGAGAKKKKLEEHMLLGQDVEDMEELRGVDDLEVPDKKDDLDVKKEKDNLEDLDVLDEKGDQGSRVVDEREQGGFVLAGRDRLRFTIKLTSL